ncbi:unnamed protein product [Auanema sp. JU1783]|nr:unnamed protein product [Auanema sp. JU1783]
MENNWYLDSPSHSEEIPSAPDSNTESSDNTSEVDGVTRLSVGKPGNDGGSNVLQRAHKPPCLLKEGKMGIGNESICVPPVLLSPVLSRPIRSHSAASSPLPIKHQGSDSESDHGTPWRPSASGMARRSLASSLASGTSLGKEPSRPNTPNLSPILKRSASGSRLAAALQGLRSGSGNGLVSGRSACLSRAESLSDQDRQRKKRNRRRTMVHGMFSESSMDSNLSSSSSNLLRLRASLGHSDPQISASSSHLPSSRNTKDVQALTQTTRSSAARRSLNASTSPLLAPRCRSPARQQGASTSRATAPAAVPLRSYSTRSGSSLMAPQHDNRRWSLASLPSTSGYGTPGSNSAFSSQYSSSEHLSEVLECMRLGGRFDSNESYPSAEDPSTSTYRPRSRSLTSPIKFGSESTASVVNRSSVYKERFPKAKLQMEQRLQGFVNENAPLSGGASNDLEATDPRNNRKSMVLEAEKITDKNLLRLLGDGATRFLHHQIVEIASDCLARSIEDSITCSYFCEMSQRLDETLNEAQQKTCQDSLTFLSKLVKQLLMIVSRPARLLECLEFDPDEFYHLLEEAEGVVREQLGSGTARVPDLPQYIIGKLGLDRDPLMDIEARAESPPAAPSTSTGGASSSACSGSTVAGTAMKKEESGPAAKHWNEQRPPREEDFETIRLVSNGAYGAVYLVRHRETRQRFALKKMNKQTLLLRNQIDQVFAERDILTMTDNPFVVCFYGSFETKHHLCMLMEYVEGGDCAALLKNAGTLPVDLARLYVAETVLAIEYLHSYGIVHRDLKPDNLLITAMGHIKLTDFGLSKIGLMSRTTLVAEGVDIVETQQFRDKQLCGTPEYIAPEVILRQGYGKPVDFWALGIILYEFLIGTVPFSGESPEELFSNVISEDVEYPDGDEALPVEAEDLIRRLMEKNPMERLGAIAGASQLMAHSFFDCIDFNTILREKAEFVPLLDNEEDTSYFDTRLDRYNHEADSCGEEDSSPMFHSFSTASPRHSIVALDVNQLPMAASVSSSYSGSSTVPLEPRCRKPSTATQSSEDQTMDSADLTTEVPVSSAMILRRQFSSQRNANLSTSSSGTTGTGCQNTAYSSTDSSMDASHVSMIVIPDARKSPLPKFAISCDPDDSSEATSSKSVKELSPVDETVRFRNTPQTPLQLVIPATGATTSSNSSNSKDTCYVVASGCSQLSPGGGSMSSASSADGSPHPSADQISPATNFFKCVTIRKGSMGFGFTLKSVRVYLGEHSDYYTIEHIVTSVVTGSPAFEAGLRGDDMIIQVNGQLVHNLTHPQLMHRLLSYGNELSLRVTPLSSTSIKEGAPRKTVGKMAKKKPKRPQRRVPLEKKTRKPSSLLRRLSGKRATNDIVPGTSSQKQTFIPRSVSSQDGAILNGPPPAPNHSLAATQPPSAPSAAPSVLSHKRMSDVGLREENRSPLASSRPSSLRGLKQTTAQTTSKIPTSPIPVSPLARSEGQQESTRSPSPSAAKFSSGRSLMNRILHKDDSN